MKLFKIIMLVLVSFSSSSMYAQEEEIEQLLSVESISVSGVTDICSPDICTNDKGKSGDLSRQLSVSNDHNPSNDRNSPQFQVKMMAAKKAQKFEAYSVAINVLHGFTFHISDYHDGTRVITALDGDMRGYQAIGVNGVIVTSSNAVEWHGNYFVHYYQYGKVISYPNRQTSELY